ncbi:MAG: phosphoadenylyl-sulfate reductase [Flavobacteriales bacterium]
MLDALHASLPQDPAAALAEIATRFPGKVTFTTSLGEEDQAITHLIAAHNLPIRMVTLDTGRLFTESYDLLSRTRAKYKVDIDVFAPDTEAVQTYVNTHGINAFYNSVELRKGCCGVRKIEPLRRSLAGAQVWVTGLRAAQSDNRADLPRLEEDALTGLIKFHPLLAWDDAQLRGYLNEHNVPVNPLHNQGFVSIGCAPCTRAIEEGEHPRAGRWWWEQSKKECGLHQH